MTDQHPIIATALHVDIQAAATGKIPRFTIDPAYTGGVLQTDKYKTGIIVDLSNLVTNEQNITATLRHDDGLNVGHIDTVRNDGQTLCLGGPISFAGGAADEVLASHQRGFRWKASIEARPLEKPEFVPRGETVFVNNQTFSGPVLVSRKSELFGVSFVARGADAQTNVQISAQAKKGIKPMTTDTQRLLGETLDEILADANIERESTRKYGQLLKAQAMAGEITVDDFQGRLIKAAEAGKELERIRAERPTGPTITSGHGGTNGHAIQAAFFKHLGQETLGEKTLGAEAMEQGAMLRATSMMDLVKASLTAAGHDIPTSRDDMIRAAFSTTDLPGMLGDSANKLLLDAYQAVPSVARIVAKRLSANDFKTATGYRLTGDSKFQHLPAGGEIKHGTLSEQSYTYRVDTYARMFGIDRRDIINDDLGAFQTVPQIIGRGAAVALEELFWKLVLANTSSFFGSDNENYIDGADSALSITSLSEAVTKIRKQVDTEGTSIMVAPKYLVVPPELETTGDALYTSTNIAVAGTTDVEKPDGNPHQGKYEPQVVPHLSNSTYTGYSTTGWYLFGIADDVAPFGISYLNGVESPTVESQDAPFNTLGVQYRGYLDYGVCQVDHRGGVKSKGAA